MYVLVWHRIKGFFLSCWIALVDLFYPQLCLVCGECLVKGEKYLCSHCLVDFPFADATDLAHSPVLDIFESDSRPECLHALFYYNKYSPYRKLIYAIKYLSYRELGRYLGRMLGERLRGVCKADCIIPVPLHKKRERKRGFNQAYEIALGLSEVLGIEILNDVVIRIKNNVSQTGKNALERQRNVENIFKLCNPQQIEGRHVLLLDDVITTGATLKSCLQVLNQAENVTFSLGCLGKTI